MTYNEILHHPEVLALLERGNYNLGVLGFTDHSKIHCALVAERAAYILRKLLRLIFIFQHFNAFNLFIVSLKISNLIVSK